MNKKLCYLLDIDCGVDDYLEGWFHCLRAPPGKEIILLGQSPKLPSGKYFILMQSIQMSSDSLNDMGYVYLNFTISIKLSS